MLGIDVGCCEGSSCGADGYDGHYSTDCCYGATNIMLILVVITVVAGYDMHEGRTRGICYNYTSY